MNEGYARELNLEVRRRTALHVATKRRPSVPFEGTTDYGLDKLDAEAQEAERQPTGAVILILALVFAVLVMAGTILAVLRPESFAWLLR